jgi:ribulose-phosphate 3-epimerase
MARQNNQHSTRPVIVAPSILSADFRALEREVKAAQDAGADRIHCDAMDGHFVPNITFGPMVIEAVKKSVAIPLDVHLMIADPDRYVDAFCDAGADILLVHAEACKDLDATLGRIRARNVKPGVAVDPDKPVDLFLPRLAAIDQVLIMTVYAGFGGQAFIADSLPKIKLVADQAARLGLCIDIEVDGGINHDTARVCAQHGANIFVAGNYVFHSSDYQGRIKAIRDAAAEGNVRV